MSVIGIYFESWYSKWTSDYTQLDLANVDSRVNLINIAFANPNCTYIKGSMSFNGTGLSFSQDFNVVKNAIGYLKNMGVKVMLSVGGATYWTNKTVYNVKNVVDLMYDLGCSGIDVDWEVGINDEQSLIDALKSTRNLIGTFNYLSFCGFSTGANQKRDGDNYAGSCIRTIRECGGVIDWINIMEYDTGKGFDTIGSFKNYRAIYNGRLNFGFEIGVQGWGDAITMKSDISSATIFVKNDCDGNGIFIWAWYSKPGNGATVLDAISIASDTFKTAPTKPTYSLPSSVYVTCPNCNFKIKNSWST